MIQLQILNKILDEKDFSFITLNNINNSYFSEYTNEFNYIKNHFDSYGNVPDKTSFLSNFPNFDIIIVNESKEYLLNELYKDKKTKYLTETFSKMRSLIIANKTEEAESLLNKISNETIKFNNINSINLLEDKTRYNSYIEKCNNYSKFFIKTGFIELDKLIGGWDRKEELATIVGRPGIGKSFILFKCALAAAEQGLNVGLYEGEMSEDNVGYRIDSLISHISNGQLTHGNSNVQSEYKEHLNNIKSKIKGNINILTPNMLGGLATVSDLRSFIYKDKLDILFIDQYSLLDDERAAKGATERTTNIAKDLKSLQVLSKIPIIAASQQNREKEDQGVTLRQIAQSDMIGQNSTIVLFIDKKDDVLSIYLTKSRYAGSGKDLKYKVDYDKGLYINIPEDEDNNEISEKEIENIKSSYEIDNVIGGGNPF